ncbi:MAG: hypothetical protein AAFN10_28885, partial [Bacteroidota bacterium]
MKHFLLSLCLLSFCTLLSQERPLAYYAYSWDSQRFDWILRLEEQYQYDQNDSLLQKVRSQYEHPNSISVDQRYLSQYDTKGNQTFELTQF